MSSSNLTLFGKSDMVRSDRKDFISLLTFFGISVGVLLCHFLMPHPGYSLPLSLIFPVILISGVWFTRKSLLFYFQDKVVDFTLVLLAFATNLFFLGIFSNLLQPLLLFAFYATLIFLTISWYRRPSIITSVCLGIITGLIMLFHPTGYFALLIPVLWNENQTTRKEKIVLIRKYRMHALIFLMLVISVVVISNFGFSMKPGEIPFLDLKLPGLFTVGSRYLWNDLLSFDHGWLIYSPIMIIPALGFYFFAEKEKHLFIGIFIFCTLDIIAESCWTKLGNTPIFGQVAFIQLYALLAFAAAGFCDWILDQRRIFQVLSFFIIFLMILLNLFQTWQYLEGIIPSSGMTEEIYSMVFGRTNLTGDEKWRIIEITGEETDMSRIRQSMVQRTLLEYDFEHPNPAYLRNWVSEQVKYGRTAFKMDTGMRFTPNLNVSYQELTKQSRVIVRISAAVYCKNPLQGNSLFLVLTSSHNGNYYRYRMVDIGKFGLVPGQWKTVAFDYHTPVNPQPEDRLQGYIYYPGNQTILVDNLKFDLFEQKN
jgi:hypothetical protein